MANMNSIVNSFYHDNVQLARDDAKKHRDIAYPNVEKILDYVNKLDGRFGKEPMKVGSYWGGLKVDKADEFDYDIVLQGITKLHWGNDSSQRYYELQFKRAIPGRSGTSLKNVDKTVPDKPLETTPEDLDVVRSSVPLPPPPTDYLFMPYPVGTWSKCDDLVRQGDLVPFLVKKQLKHLLTAAIRDLNLRGEVRQSRKSRGPAVTVSFEAGGRNISIDFAPVIRCHLAMHDLLGWPRPGLAGARWPDSVKVDRIKEIGINAVAKTEFYWMYSFSEAEKELVAGIDIDGGKRKELHRVMKKLNTDFWCPTTKPIITSYILKNIWFWELEKYPDGQYWDNDHVWIRLESMTQALLRAIQTEKLSQYFHPAVNLIDYNKDPDQLAAAKIKIQDFLGDPKKYLCDG